MKLPILVLFCMIFCGLVAAAAVAFDVSDCQARGGVYVKTLFGYECMKAGFR